LSEGGAAARLREQPGVMRSSEMLGTKTSSPAQFQPSCAQAAHALSVHFHLLID
jgi:hypothetical protein